MRMIYGDRTVEVLERLPDNKSKIMIEFADYTLNYPIAVSSNKLKDIPKHICDFDDFNGICHICGEKK